MQACEEQQASERTSSMSAAKVDEDRRKEIGEACKAEAWRTGATSALTALGLSGAAVGGANYFFHGFRTSLGVSGKAALVVSSVHCGAALYACVSGLTCMPSFRCPQLLPCSGCILNWHCTNAHKNVSSRHLRSPGKRSLLDCA